MGPRELVLNPKLSAWRHPDGAVKANRLPPRATTAGAPDCYSSNRSLCELRRPRPQRLSPPPLGDGQPTSLLAVLLARVRRLLRHRLLSLRRAS